MIRTPAESNAGRITRNIDMTLENFARTNNCIAFAQDRNLKARMREKNERRIKEIERMSGKG